jgi:hypothetical protein
MLVLLPRIHRPAEDEEKIIGSQARDGLPFEQAHRLRNEPVLGEKVEEAAGMVVVHMLQNKRALHQKITSPAA